jgi:hypothetical protein
MTKEVIIIMLSIFNTEHKGWEDQNTSLNYYELFMDNSDELPTDPYYFSTDKARFKIAQGSLAYDISTGTIYIMNSEGSWIQQ